MTQRDRFLGRWALWMVLPMCLAWLAPIPAFADDRVKTAAKSDALDNEPAEFLRFSEDGKGGGKLEAAIATYKNEAGVTVHLVGAVHVGEKQYYEGLAKTFEGYDALLYEMVKPQNMDAPVRGAKPKSMISMFQHLLKDVLELDFQLDDIDYTKKNFIHADLDAETFSKMQEERGESLVGLMLGQMMRQFAKQLEGGANSKVPEVGLLDLIEAFNSPDRARQFKLILGRQFGDIEEQMAGMQGTVLVTERNKKALSTLKDTIRSGKKNIGIFYGAAHMTDMESRLALMGFKRTGMEWRTAWDMTEKPEAKGKDKEEKQNERE